MKPRMLKFLTVGPQENTDGSYILSGSFKETQVDWQVKGKNEFDSLNFTPTRNPTELFWF